MNKIELIRRLLEFSDSMDSEISIRVIERDEQDIVKTQQIVRISSVTHMLEHPYINIELSDINKAPITSI